MKKEDIENILEIIDIEGFDYGIVYNSDFEEVTDETFHKMRGKFLEARQTLKKYIVSCAELNNIEADID